jgi:hypothetical protein
MSDTSGDADSDTTAETHREKERSRLSIVAFEKECVAKLRANQDHYEKLQSIAAKAQEVIGRLHPGRTVVLYGSLALCKEERYYLTNTSDADLAICGSEQMVRIVEALTSDGWEVQSKVQLQRFGTNQFTLRHAQGQLLDLTFLSSEQHFRLFEERQQAFRKLFESARDRLVGHFYERGGEIFDAYVHLLKCFASCGGMSSFQAVCTGLFVLHYEINRWESLVGVKTGVKPESMRTLPLFERFLHFVATFFAGSAGGMQHQAWQVLKEKTKLQQYPPLEIISGMGGCSAWVLDLSTSTWHPRNSRYWFAEMYFSEVEIENNVPESKRMNIAHSVVPQLVATNAGWMMKRLMAASPMHYSSWSPDSERRRMEVLVEILSRREVDPRMEAAFAAPTPPPALHPAVERVAKQPAELDKAEPPAAVEQGAQEAEPAQPEPITAKPAAVAAEA